MRQVLAYLAFALGAYICLLNFYLSWIRIPLLRAFGRSPGWISGFPFIGSLLLAIAAALLWEKRGLAITALVLAVLACLMRERSGTACHGYDCRTGAA